MNILNNNMPPKKSVIDNVKSKKRGRPKKNSTIKSKTSPIEKVPVFNTCENKNNEIVLCLPLNISDYNKCDNKDDYNDIFTQENTNTSTCDDQFTITDMVYSDSSNESLDSKKYSKNAIEKIKELEKECNTLKEKIKYYEDTYNIGLKDDNIHKIKLKIYDIIDNKKINIKSTKTSCWWCTYKFSTEPYYLPEKVVGDTFYVLGNFCMPECAAAYNEYDLDDYKKEDRFCLLNKMYPKKKGKCISLAPRREFLVDYGGPMDIIKYRQISRNSSKSYRLILPPMKPLVPIVEERDNNRKKLHYISKDALVLKRSKPLYKTNNHFFGSIHK